MAVLERTKNAKRNGIWGLLNRIFTLLLPFFLRTVMIYTFGADYLGLSGLFTSILTVLNLSELGVGSAIVFSMYKPIAEDNEEEICALMNFYKKMYRIIGLFVLICGCAFVPFISFFVKTDIPEGINIYILYFIYLANACVSYWLFAYKNCLLHAHQRDDITSKINIIVNFALYICQIIVLLTIRNYYVFVVLQPLFTVLINIINAFFANRMFPHYKCNGKLEKVALGDIKQRVIGLSMIKVAAVSRNAFDSIILSAFIGLRVVAIYNNYYYIMNALSGMLWVITSAISAGIGNSIAIETREKNLEDMRIMNIIYMIISGFCASCLLSLYQPFMRLWVGTDLMFPNAIVFLFSVYFLLTKLCDVQGQYFDAAGLWWYGKWRGVIEAFVNLTLNIILGYFWGVAGIIMATIISVVFVNIPLVTYYTFKYYFKTSPLSYIRDQLLLLGVSVIVCIVSYFLTYNLPVGTDWISIVLNLIIRVVICFIVSTILFFGILWKKPIFIKALRWLKVRIMRG